MIDKTNTNSPEVVYRKVVIIGKEELKTWKKHFSLFGSKTELQREVGVHPNTLSGILKAGKGEKRIVDNIRAFIESQYSNGTETNAKTA